MTKKADVHAGRFYGRTFAGKFVELGATDQQPDVWICRRLADFPNQTVPAGGSVTFCTRCDAAIVFNPARQVMASKVCMQCASIQPLPIEGPP